MFVGIDTHVQVDGAILKKTALAKKVGEYLTGDCAPMAAEVDTVLELARALAADLELNVRTTLAFELRNSQLVPKDLAEKIALDVENVASPFLVETPVLSDQDLARLVPELAEYARASIARRTDIGPKSISAIIDNGGNASVSHLMHNKSAEISEADIERAYLQFRDAPGFIQALSTRNDLPMTIIDQILDRVAEKARNTLVERYALHPHLAKRESETARVKALFDRIAKAGPDQVRAFVTELKQTNRLSTRIMAEALNRREKRFFEAAVAITSGRTIAAARHVLENGPTRERVKLLASVGYERVEIGDVVTQIDDIWTRDR